MMSCSPLLAIFAVVAVLLFAVLSTLSDVHRAKLLHKDEEIAALQGKMVVLRNNVHEHQLELLDKNKKFNLQLAEANKVSRQLSAANTAVRSKSDDDASKVQDLTTSTTDQLQSFISLKDEEIERLKQQMIAQDRDSWSQHHVAYNDWKKKLQARDEALLVAQKASSRMREAIDHALGTIKRMTQDAEGRQAAMQHERAEHNDRGREMGERIQTLNEQVRELLITKKVDNVSMKYLALGNAGLSSEVMRLQRVIASLDKAVESDDAEYSELKHRNTSLEQRVTELNNKIWELENDKVNLERDTMDVEVDDVSESDDKIEGEIEEDEDEIEEDKDEIEEDEDEYTDEEQEEDEEYILV